MDIVRIMWTQIVKSPYRCADLAAHWYAAKTGGNFFDGEAYFRRLAKHAAAYGFEWDPKLSRLRTPQLDWEEVVPILKKIVAETPLTRWKS